MLVDELAHTNVPGSRHPKRWQDVEELLASGIDASIEPTPSLSQETTAVTSRKRPRTREILR